MCWYRAWSGRYLYLHRSADDEDDVGESSRRADVISCSCGRWRAEAARDTGITEGCGRWCSGRIMQWSKNAGASSTVCSWRRRRKWCRELTRWSISKPNGELFVATFSDLPNVGPKLIFLSLHLCLYYEDGACHLTLGFIKLARLPAQIAYVARLFFILTFSNFTWK